jgi:hypothetical protein
VQPDEGSILARPPNMAVHRNRRPRFRSGRPLRSLGSPLNARLLGGQAANWQFLW